MSWDDLGIEDLENIPEGYLVSWTFINAFLKAFQERADYIEQADRAKTYDDLILTGAQIGSTELIGRLLDLNNKVLKCFSNTTWYKQETWDELSAYSSGLVSASSSEGLGVITKTPWDEAALKILLTDEVYEDIFKNYSFSVSFKPTYWSGLYKLIIHVMLYRELTISIAHTPKPKEPILYLNGSETGTGSNVDGTISDAIAQSRKTTKYDNGTIILRDGGAASGAEGRWIRQVFPEPDIITEVVSNFATYHGQTKKPFCKTPALMNIETLLFRGLGEGINSSTKFNEPTMTAISEDLETIITGPIAASRVESFSEPDDFSVVYSPDQKTYISNKAENRKMPVTYVNDRCLVDISGLSDARDFGVATASAPPIEPDESSTLNEASTGSFARYELNWALCELPQDEFVFGLPLD